MVHNEFINSCEFFFSAFKISKKEFLCFFLHKQGGNAESKLAQAEREASIHMRENHRNSKSEQINESKIPNHWTNFKITQEQYFEFHKL